MSDKPAWDLSYDDPVKFVTHLNQLLKTAKTKDRFNQMVTYAKRQCPEGGSRNWLDFLCRHIDKNVDMEQIFTKTAWPKFSSDSRVECKGMDLTFWADIRDGRHLEHFLDFV